MGGARYIRGQGNNRCVPRHGEARRSKPTNHPLGGKGVGTHESADPNGDLLGQLPFHLQHPGRIIGDFVLIQALLIPLQQCGGGHTVLSLHKGNGGV